MRIGLYSPYFGATVGGGEKYLALTARALRDLVPDADVDLLGAVPPDAELYGRMLNVDLTGIGLQATNRRVTPVHRMLNRARPLRPLRNLVLARQARRLTARYDVFVPMMYRIPVTSEARRTAVLCQFPDAGGLGARGADVVVCQSRYVAEWVRRWWGVDPAIVEPPIDIPDQPPDLRRKSRTIVSVGRFFRTGHSKRQDVLVRAFGDLVRAGDLAGWELHLVGTVHREGPHAGYFEEVRDAARGLPVELHPDAPGEQVRQLLRGAAIFWHAAGFEAPADDPSAAEHFGMATAEAMAQGCVPVVYAAGGQLEVVADGDSGFHWRNLDDLRRRTLELAGDSALRLRMSERAVASAARYSTRSFGPRIVAALRPVLEPRDR